MKQKILFLLLIPTFLIIFSFSKFCLAEANVSNVPSAEKIQTLIPKPLTDLFNTFGNVHIDFSKMPFMNQVVNAIPKSGQSVANDFNWLTNGLGAINDWLKVNVGLNIIMVVKTVGEFFVWAFQGVANLIRIGLSFVK